MPLRNKLYNSLTRVCFSNTLFERCKKIYFPGIFIQVKQIIICLAQHAYQSYQQKLMESNKYLLKFHFLIKLFFLLSACASDSFFNGLLTRTCFKRFRFGVKIISPNLINKVFAERRDLHHSDRQQLLIRTRGAEEVLPRDGQRRQAAIAVSAWKTEGTKTF